jgi:heterodisulfide reductase subunit C
VARTLTFDQEIANLFYAMDSNPVQACIQCGICSGTCPAVAFMQHSPRAIIAMIRAGQKTAVLASNTYWACASCYACSVKCPQGIDVAAMMYGLKRYALWRNHFRRVPPAADFSRRFVRLITRYGRSYEPALAAPYLWRRGLRGLLDEVRMAAGLLRRGRLPLLPRRIRRVDRLRRVIGQILPAGGLT